MKNELVARIFYEIADLLTLDGVAFKPQAYRRAADVIASLDRPIEDLVADGTHHDLPGVGDAIAKKIVEIVETGRLDYYEKLKTKLPIDLHALTRVDGVGPKTAKRLYEVLGVRDLADLKRVARSGALRGVQGLGAKTEAKILRGLEETARAEGRMRLDVAMALADDLISRLRESGQFSRIEFAGSLRRGRETIGDLDLLTTAPDPEAAADAFVSLADVDQVLAHGPKKSSVRLTSGTQVDVRIVPAESFGAALQYFTGSLAHNVALRKCAVAKDWKLNEYGLFDENGAALAGEREVDVYEAMGLQFIAPELREGHGEIEAAAKHTLPVLIELSDIRGDLHLHTDGSDGKASLETMVDAARARGYDYVAITDHAKFAEVIRGLTRDDLLRQIDEIAVLNEDIEGILVLTGIEANIQQDGSLDVPDDVLERLDIVVASIHSSFRVSRADMTARLVRAVSSEHVDILGHPTARKIGERPPIEADWDAVFEAAAAHGTALELNANPVRLDLSADLVRRAISAGAKISLGTDAHGPEQYGFMHLGVMTARRGWATKDTVLNTRTAKRLQERGA